MMSLSMKFRLKDAKHHRLMELTKREMAGCMMVLQFIAKKDDEKERNQMLY